MTHTFEELLDKQRAADHAQAAVQALRDQADPPAYETAWQAWRDLVRDVQAAVTEHAKAQGAMRAAVELDVKRAVRYTE